MRGGVGRPGTDGVEVGQSSVLALGKGNELVAGAFDDGERNEVARHCPEWTPVSAPGLSTMFNG